MLQAMNGKDNSGPDKEMVGMLLECALTTTLQIYNKKNDAVARSFKVSEGLRETSKMSDTFITFCRKLCTILPSLKTLSLPKQVESQRC